MSETTGTNATLQKATGAATTGSVAVTSATAPLATSTTATPVAKVPTATEATTAIASPKVEKLAESAEMHVATDINAPATSTATTKIATSTIAAPVAKVPAATEAKAAIASAEVEKLAGSNEAAVTSTAKTAVLSADSAKSGALNEGKRLIDGKKKEVDNSKVPDVVIPPGWQVVYSKSNKRNYYFNTQNGKSVWSIKVMMAEVAAAKKRPHSSSLDSQASDAAAGSHVSKKAIRTAIRVAIIVPFRDLHSAQKRQQHLDRFVPAMSKFLSDLSPQISEFHIFIVEQSNDNRKFNRGKLLNAGFEIAGANYDSYIFHDVDLLPKAGLGEWYARYPTGPLHLARCWNRYNDDKNYFGGIVAFNKTDFERIDGFPNTYWGWGGEDDELEKRVKHFDLEISAPSERLDAVEDMEQMDIRTKLNVLRGTGWKCNVKWEVRDEYQNHRNAQHQDNPPWWGLVGIKYNELSRVKLSEFCTKVTVDLLGNKNVDGTEHWATNAIDPPPTKKSSHGGGSAKRHNTGRQQHHQYNRGGGVNDNGYGGGRW